MRQPLGPIRSPSLGILSVKAARDAQREMSTTRPVGRVKERAAGARCDSSTEDHSAETGKGHMAVFHAVGRGFKSLSVYPTGAAGYFPAALFCCHNRLIFQQKCFGQFWQGSRYCTPWTPFPAPPCTAAHFRALR